MTEFIGQRKNYLMGYDTGLIDALKIINKWRQFHKEHNQGVEITLNKIEADINQLIGN